MQNNNKIFKKLLEKELIKTSFQNKYNQLHSKYNRQNHKRISSVQKINLITFFRNKIRVYIALEKLFLFHYRVSIWYEYKGLLSNYYGVRFFYTKCNANKYIYDIKYEFDNKNINDIISTHIQLIENDCKKLKQNIDSISTNKKDEPNFF